jgi:hypothetical protein
MGRGESVIKLLFEVGHLYHRAVLDPLYEVFRQDSQYDIAFICSHGAEPSASVPSRIIPMLC